MAARADELLSEHLAGLDIALLGNLFDGALDLGLLGFDAALLAVEGALLGIDFLAPLAYLSYRGEMKK